MEIVIEPVPFDDPDAEALRTEHAAELIGRYGADLEPGKKPTAADVTVFLLARSEEEGALGCGALRKLDDTTVEIKRMFVRTTARGRGLGRQILAALEAEAAALGVQRLVLETGTEQHEAIALYEQAGFRRVPCWGPYASSAISLCYERPLEP